MNASYPCWQMEAMNKCNKFKNCPAGCYKHVTNLWNRFCYLCDLRVDLSDSLPVSLWQIPCPLHFCHISLQVFSKPSLILVSCCGPFHLFSHLLSGMEQPANHLLDGWALWNGRFCTVRGVLEFTLSKFQLWRQTPSRAQGNHSEGEVVAN